MAKVKLTTARAGNNFSQAPGQVIEVSAAEAARLLAAGQAEVLDAPGRETAALDPAAREVHQPARRRAKGRI